MPGSTAGAQRVGLRAEHLRIVQAKQGIAATVVLAEHLGDSSILYLRVEGIPDLLSAKVGAGQDHLVSGQEVSLTLDAAWTLTFDAAGRRII